MRMKSCIMLTVVLFVSNIIGMDITEWLKNINLFDSVSTTSTSLTVKTKSSIPFCLIWNQKTNSYLRPDTDLVFTPDMETRLSDGFHASIHFIPVSFKNQQRGFRIKEMFYDGIDNKTVRLVYAALGEVLVQMGEDDVKMILEKEGWVKYEQPQSASPPEDNSRAASPRLAESKRGDGIPAVESSDGFQPLEQADTIPPTTGNRHRLWLYAVIPLGLLAVLYFIRRKSKN